MVAPQAKMYTFKVKDCIASFEAFMVVMFQVEVFWVVTL
jgi:hypothetical protein